MPPSGAAKRKERERLYMKCPLVRKLAVCLRSLWSGIPASPHPPAVFNTFRFSFIFFWNNYIIYVIYYFLMKGS